MSILKSIIQNKKKEIEEAKKTLPLEKLLPKLVSAPPSRNFKAALARAEGLAVIAEIKHASPSKGVLMRPFQPLRLAQAYAAGGAAAISVVTDAKFFKGELSLIEAVKKECPLPVLRKDFILDPWQLYETRWARADAVLIIASLFPETRQLRKMIQLAQNLSLTPVVEVHTPSEFKQALRCEAEVIGVNNRNLSTFKVDLETTARILKRAPSEKIYVSESGVESPQDAARLHQAGAKAVLVGEALIKSKDPAALLSQIRAAGAPDGSWTSSAFRRSA